MVSEVLRTLLEGNKRHLGRKAGGPHIRGSRIGKYLRRKSKIRKGKPRIYPERSEPSAEGRNRQQASKKISPEPGEGDQSRPINYGKLENSLRGGFSKVT